MSAAVELVTVGLPRAEVFDFLANGIHLPDWAAAAVDDGETANGVRVEADSCSGVVDVWRQDGRGRPRLVLAARVLNAPDGGALVVCLCQAAPGTSNDAEERQRARLRADLAQLPERVGAAVCFW